MVILGFDYTSINAENSKRDWSFWENLIKKVLMAINLLILKDIKNGKF
jgi:hypothetical protein